MTLHGNRITLHGKQRRAPVAQPVLAMLVLDKIREQVERIQHLLELTPPERLDWRPNFPDSPNSPFTLGVLLGHLLECLAGFCAVLHKAHPDRLSHFLALRGLPVNHACLVDEARHRVASYAAHIEEGFSCLADEQLSRLVPTAFVPEGEAVLTLLLGNLEHLINHKFQLFSYLKMLGVPVGTADLYHPRGEGES